MLRKANPNRKPKLLVDEVRDEREVEELLRRVKAFVDSVGDRGKTELKEEVRCSSKSSKSRKKLIAEIRELESK